MKSIKKLENSSVLFATFSMWSEGKRMPTNGNVEPFRDYLLGKKISKLVLIDQPVPSSQFVMPRIEIYSRNSKKIQVRNSSWWIYPLLPLLNLFNTHGTRIVFKIRDFCSVIDAGFRFNQKYDYIVGLESINCLAGLILRKLGRVEKVIYYVLDFSGSRYTNNLFNKFYVFLDKLCAMHADYIWDVSYEFQKVRIANGLDLSKSAPCIRVPVGLYDYQIVSPKIKKQKTHTLVFVGTLGEENGPDLAIKSLALLLDKYPDIVLHIIGGGERNMQRLKKLTQSLNLTNHITFHGYIPNIRQLVNVISKLYIAVAPYLQISGSIRYYADSGKIRTYSGAGLPVITTRVPPLGRELSRLGGAIVIEDNPLEMASAIDLLFKNTNLYNRMRKTVMEFSKDNTWTNEFDKAFKTMLS